MKLTRLDAMEQYILQNEKVTISQLKKRFDISVNTLRRDLDELERRGHVGKVYGGAAARVQPSLTTMPKRFQMNTTQKLLIGEMAASLIPPDTTVFIDSGSTTYHIVRFLGDRRLTMVSHSLPVLSEASRLKKANLISPGGIYNASLGAFVGVSTIDTIKTLSVNVAVMAATGVSIKHGLSNTTYFEAEIKRAVVAGAKKIILMADHSKFDREALITYCPLERVNVAVTDKEPGKEYMTFFEEHGIEVLFPVSETSSGSR